MIRPHIPSDFSLNEIIDLLREGSFVIPDFQREFEWKAGDLRELMKSIFLGYYIGNLLFWKASKANLNSLECRPIHGYEGKKPGDRTHIVLDGQQRLTAMYYAFFAPNAPMSIQTNRRHIYFIDIEKFVNEDYENAFIHEIGDITHADQEKIIPEPEMQFIGNIFPLSLISGGSDKLWGWINDYKQYYNASPDAAQRIEMVSDFGKKLDEIYRKYKVAYIELDESLDIEKVCDIFTKINSRGVRLGMFDLMNAMLKPRGLQLRKMWDEVSPKLDFVKSDKMDVYILQVMSLLKQDSCSPRSLYHLIPKRKKPIRDQNRKLQNKILVLDADDFKKSWDISVSALKSVIDLLRCPQELGAISSDYIPYTSILPVFAALESYVQSLLQEEQAAARAKIRYWYWVSVFSHRYSSAVQSTSASDFRIMKKWIKDNDDPKIAMISEDLNLRDQIKRGDSVYNGVFNLMIRQGARDWGTGEITPHRDLVDHHIVPVSWGRKNLSGKLIHSILNRTPLTINRHSNIKDLLPNEYLGEMIKESGGDTIRAILESHFISQDAQEILLRNPFTPDDFEEFISERQRILQNVINNVVAAERTLSDQQEVDKQLIDERTLHKLCGQISKIELKLRDIISANLNDDPIKVSSAERGLLKRRVPKEEKNSIIASADYQNKLCHRLQYSYLGDLRIIITSDKCWSKFTDQFSGNKAALNLMFDRLRYLRNPLSHSRAISKSIFEEGTQAILWFNEVLGI